MKLQRARRRKTNQKNHYNVDYANTSPHPPHTRGTFHRRLQPLYTKKQKVSFCVFFPKRSQCNILAAIKMRFETPASKTRCNCNAQEDAKHIETAVIRCGLPPHQPAPAAHTRCTFHRRPGPLYPKKQKLSCPGLLPQRSPCNIHAATTMRFVASRRTLASLEEHGKQHGNIHAAIPLQFATCDVKSYTALH